MKNTQLITEIAWRPFSASSCYLTYDTTPSKSVGALYYVVLRNQDGDVVAVFDQWDSLYMKNVVDGIGNYYIAFLDDGNPKLDRFELDGQIYVYRSVPSIGLDWYVEFRGLHRKLTKSMTSGGKRYIVSEGVEFNEMLARHVIGYDAGTILADKEMAAEQAMWEYVDENCGASASTANGRKLNAIFPRFSVVKNASPAGKKWMDSKAYENLLDVLQSIAIETGIDFAVNGSNGEFVFNTYPTGFGANRTRGGINPSTGKNAAGNTPVLFALENDNISELTYSIDRLQEVTGVLVLGKGEGSTRVTLGVQDSADADDSPWNTREISRPASNAEYTYQLAQFGLETLWACDKRVSVSFTPQQSANCMYGKHYWLGDAVTVNYGTEYHDERIMQSTINISGGRENITLELVNRVR